MVKFNRFVVLAMFVIVAQTVFAKDSPRVHGVWRMVAYEIEIQATGQKEPVMGENPTGYAIFTPEGRVWFVLTGEGRKPAKTVEDRAELLNSMVAYTGMYRIEQDMWITKVDVAWNPEWLGTEQAREFKKATPLTGLILTKLDGTAKGGIVFAIAKELQLPIKFIGTGEALDDFAEFDAQEFVDGLFE